MTRSGCFLPVRIPAGPVEVSQWGAIMLALLSPQLTHPPIRANVAEVAGQRLGGGYWLRALKH